MDSTLIDVDVGSGTGSIDMDLTSVDMVFGAMSGAKIKMETETATETKPDENNGRRGDVGSEMSHSRGPSTAFFDPEAILIIDHRGLGHCAREGEMCHGGEGEDAWVSQLDAVSELERHRGDGDSQDDHSLDEAERSLGSSSHSRRLSINSFHSIQSFDSRGTHSSWFA